MTIQIFSLFTNKLSQFRGICSRMEACVIGTTKLQKS